MDKRLYDIQIRSLRAAIEHMGMTDLAELQARASAHGTPEDRALIDAVMTLMRGLPPNTRHL